MSDPAVAQNNLIEIDNLIDRVTRDVSSLTDDIDYRLYNKLGSINSFSNLLLNINYEPNKEHFHLAQFDDNDKEYGVRSTLNIERLKDGTYDLTQVQTFEGELEPVIEKENVSEDELSDLLENLFTTKPQFKKQYEEQIKDRQVFFSVSNLIQRASYDVRCNSYDDLNLLDLDDNKKGEYQKTDESKVAFDGLLDPEIYGKVFDASEKTVCSSELKEQKANTGHLKFELKEVENKKTHKKMYVMCETVKHAGVEQKLYSRFRTLDDFKVVAGACLKHTYPEIEQDMSNQIQEHKKKAHSFFSIMRSKPQVPVLEQQQNLEKQIEAEKKNVEIIKNLTKYREENELKAQEENIRTMDLPAAQAEKNENSMTLPTYKKEDTLYIEKNLNVGSTPETDMILSQHGRELPFFLKQKRSIWEVSKNIFKAFPQIIHDSALTFYKGLKEVNSEKYMNMTDLTTFLGRAYVPQEKKELGLEKPMMLEENPSLGRSR